MIHDMAPGALQPSQEEREAYDFDDEDAFDAPDAGVPRPLHEQPLHEQPLYEKPSHEKPPLETFHPDREARPRLMTRARLLKAEEVGVWTRTHLVLDAAETVRREGVRAAEAARAEAIRQGHAEGYAAGADAVAAQMAGASRAIQAHYRSLETALPPLVMNIVERVVEGFDDARLVASATRRALAEQRGAERFRLWVAPDAVEPVTAMLADAQAYHDAGSVADLVEVEADPDLPPGRALLWSRFGSIELSVSEQLERFRAALVQEVSTAAGDVPR